MRAVDVRPLPTVLLMLLEINKSASDNARMIARKSMTAVKLLFAHSLASASAINSALTCATTSDLEMNANKTAPSNSPNLKS